MGLVLGDESYKIVGISYKVFNALGYGHQEKIYQNAFEQELIEEKIPYQREFYVPLEYKGVIIGKGFLDFFINHKLIIELKVSPTMREPHFRQVLEYLRITNAELALLIFFTSSGIHHRRILNPHNKNR